MKFDDIVLPILWVTCIISIICWLMVMAGHGKKKHSITIMWVGYMMALGGLLFACIYESTQ